MIFLPAILVAESVNPDGNLVELQMGNIKQSGFQSDYEIESSEEQEGCVCNCGGDRWSSSIDMCIRSCK